ncbi:MAG: DUF1273 family protein [Clostridia bacterium]|nr:DUF1273 family protein [Clostridia bacterium]
MINCSFTGHRIIENSLKEKLESRLSDAIEYVYREGCRNFYCGGALGFDTVAAKLLIKLRMKHRDMRLIIAVPCRDQSLKWTEPQRRMYDYILSSADEIIYTSEEYTKDCMRRRNLYLVENCDVLIAYSGRQNSGSAQTVRMAEKLGKTVYNLYGKLDV